MTSATVRADARNVRLYTIRIGSTPLEPFLFFHFVSLLCLRSTLRLYTFCPSLTNCHELRMHLSKFVCGDMPGLLATFRSRNLLFCLELSLSPPKARHIRAILPCIDAALNHTWKVQAPFFKLNCSWQFPFKEQSLFIRVNRILNSAFQISITQI